MTIDITYRTTVIAVGGREGRAYAQDGTLDLDIATPRELGGAGGAGTNPEQLFAAGYAACFLSALQRAGKDQGVELPDAASIAATVGIGPNGDGGFGLAVALAAHLPGIGEEVAEQLMAHAHLICPYSNATRDNIDVDLRVA